MASVAPVPTAQFHPRYAAGEALGAEITELCAWFTPPPTGCWC